MKCPICTDYFDAREVTFKKLYLKSYTDYIRVCPKCWEEKNKKI